MRYGGDSERRDGDRSGSSKRSVHALSAATAGLALRLSFAWQFPYHDSGDTSVYEQLARNWSEHGVYGLQVAGRLEAADIRMPGYPAFLAAVYRAFGPSVRAVMVCQAIVDVGACFAVAALAALLAPKDSRRRVAVAALWLAASCPFVANYTATVLTEALATDGTAVALLLLAAHETKPANGLLFAAGLVTGLCTLVRPESPLLVITIMAVLAARAWRPSQWPTLVKPGAILLVGVMLPLAPWVIRNGLTLHEVRFLAPRYSELPPEYAPRGIFGWTSTWLWRFRDVEAVSWKIDGEAVRIEDVPAQAFDSDAERGRVAELLEEYDRTCKITPEVDAGFAEIEHRRTQRHPLRTYLAVPVLRAWTLWFTPRVEMLPAAEFLWPIGEAWENDPGGFCLTVGLAVLNAAYVALAVAGAWRARRRKITALLVSFIVVRTGFLTTALAPEPRYVLECFPAVLALAAYRLGASPTADGPRPSHSSAVPSK